MTEPSRAQRAGAAPGRSGRSWGERLEVWTEEGLFRARWLLAPIYVGLMLSLIAIVIVFAKDLVTLFGALFDPKLKAETVILIVLSLIDLSLAANLVLIVVFSGFESFVSKIDNADHPDRPEWMGKIDFGGLKLKLVASIAAISAIQLLKVFVQEQNLDTVRVLLLIAVHLTFVVSGVLLAVMDYLSARSKSLGYTGD